MGYVFLVFFAGCTSKIQKQEPVSNTEEEKKIELLNNDSTYIEECILITASEKTLKDRQYAILLNIVSHYIKENYSDIQKRDGLNCGMPMAIEVHQERDYKKNNLYYIGWGGTGLADTTLTDIIKIQDRYIFIQLLNEKTLSKETLPEIFLKNCEQEEIIFVINELSWVVLMCKNSTKHIVVKNVFSIEDKECVKYFDEFSCE